MKAFRWTLVALAVVLATILVVRGDVLVGSVLGAVAISRAVLFARLRRRELYRDGA